MADAPRSPVSLEGLDLAALVASRVCHDVISRSAPSSTGWS